MLKAGYYLDSFLAPLSPWLAQEDVTDIYINRPGEVWVEALGGRIERHEDDSLTESDEKKDNNQLLDRVSQLGKGFKRILIKGRFIGENSDKGSDGRSDAIRLVECSTHSNHSSFGVLSVGPCNK